MPQIPLPGDPVTGVPANRAGQVGWYRNYISNAFKGVYNGNGKYQGMTFPQIYDSILASSPRISPLDATKDVASIWVAAKLAGVIIAATTVAGTAAAATGQASVNVGSQFASILSPLDFFASPQFWIRAGEVLLGLVLIAAGVSKLAGDSGIAGSIVSKVPAVAAVKKGLKIA